MRPFAFFVACLLAPLAFSQGSRIDVGDALLVEVVGFPTYGGKLVVLSDGSIEGRGIGRVKVAGLDSDAAERTIRQRLAKTLKNPSVSVSILEQRRAVVYLVSSRAQGASPGPIELQPRMDLRSVAGLVSVDTEPSQYRVRLYRAGAVAYDGLLDAVLGSDQASPHLQAEDVISILPIERIRVWVTGSVRRPGELRVPAGVNLQQAIASAGGLSAEDSLLAEIKIQHRRGDKTHEFAWNGGMGVALEEGDTLTVSLPDRIRVVVSGEVTNPGEQVLRSGDSLSAAIARAKGVTPVGTLRNVVVLRRGEAMSVDLSQIVAGGIATAEDGDLIYVRRNENCVYVLGQVREPGKYTVPDGETWDAAQALAAAKGLDQQGTLRRVTLVRPAADGRFETKQFHLDELLKDGKAAGTVRLQAGDMLLFGSPKGINLEKAGQILPFFFFLDSIAKR